MKKFMLSLLLVGVLILPVLANDYFPLETGNWWQYTGVEVDASGFPIPGTEYTSYSKVVGDTMISDKTYWVMQDSSDQGGSWELRDTTYIRTVGDTLKMLMNFFDQAQLEEISMAILPGYQGMTWAIYHFDSTWVDSGATIHMLFDFTGEILDYDNIMVPYGWLTDVCHVRHNMHMEMSVQSPMGDTTIIGDNYSDLWAARDIGPAKFFQLPTTGPGDPQPGSREMLVDFEINTAVASGDHTLNPSSFSIKHPFPNPFNPITEIRFELPQATQVTAIVYDVAGHEIRRILNRPMSVGAHSVSFDGTDLASGIYVLNFRAGSYQANRKLILLK